MNGDNAVAAVIAHVAAVAGDTTDMIKVMDESMEEDEEKLVSTIEHVTGGAGEDTLTGDARANTLKGGGGVDTLNGVAGNDMLMGGEGADTLNGGAGNDMLMGGEGEDTLNGGEGNDIYVAVEAGAAADIVTEGSDEGMDTVHYTAPADVESTEDMDESQDGVTVSPTPDNVEVVAGTQNGDTITADQDDGATILGLEGDDTLNGGAGVDTLVGCAGKNMLTGAGGSDVFGVFKDDGNIDTITDFATGTGMATTDEIHLKGFGAGVATVGLVPGNSTHAGVLVDGDLVAIVTTTSGSNIEAVTAVPNDTPPVVGKNLAEAIVEALGKDNAAGVAVVRTVEFD